MGVPSIPLGSHSSSSSVLVTPTTAHTSTSTTGDEEYIFTFTLNRPKANTFNLTRWLPISQNLTDCVEAISAVKNPFLIGCGIAEIKAQNQRDRFYPYA